MALFRENVLKARNHIIFVVALVVGTFIVHYLDKLEFKHKGMILTEFKTTAPKIDVKLETLTEKEIEYAKIAWKYFQNNYQEKTGLVNSVNNFPSTTLWDSGNYLMALHSAYRLKIVQTEEFEKRLSKILDSLAKIPLYNDELPNKVYDTRTLAMTNYANKPSVKGIGWSAIDIGRLLVPLAVVNYHYPKFNPKVKAIIKRWKITRLAKDGAFYGALFEKKKERIVQEGRLGYEQYTSKMFASFGIDVSNAIRYDKYLDFSSIYDIKIPHDIRDMKNSNANNYVLSEPYMLDGLEFGWDFYSKEFSYRVYKAQQKRFDDTSILTAVSEDHIDKAPYFIYNCVFVNGREWVAISEKGKVRNDLKQVSTKASFAFYALYRDEYSKKLINFVKEANDPDNGWYAGIYEKGFKVNKALTCNTNAIILESLLYKQEGALFRLIGR